MNSPLRIVPFPGIHADSLGHYLLALGLLRAASSRWPEARGVWRNSVFHLVGSFTQESIGGFLADEWQPTSYERWWADPFDSDRSVKIPAQRRQLAMARSAANRSSLAALDATIVTVSGLLSGNPIFGNLAGKNGDKRDFSASLDFHGKPFA
jgi:hypothetical protein